MFAEQCGTICDLYAYTPMLHALVVLAAEKAEPDKTAFYILGGVWVAWAVVLSAIGFIHRRQGRWAEALTELTHVTGLNPRDHGVFFELGLTYGLLLHRYADADHALERAISLAPDIPLSQRDPSGPTPVLLETSRAGIFGVGDVRSGSIKRVAAAIGEGSMAVRLVFDRLQASVVAVTEPAQAAR